MKFWPYCGAELPDNAAFCMECGKAITEKEQQTELEAKKPPKKKGKPKKEKGSQKNKQPQVPDEPEPPVDDGYDGYYDDVRPEDADTVDQGIDKQLIKKVAVLGISAMLIIIACVAIMYML